VLALLNGHLLPAEQAAVPLTDRGFLYGDGVFETLRVEKGRPFAWDAHVARLAQGASVLGIALPCSAGELRAQADTLLRQHDGSPALLRIQLTRGSGPRGDSPRDARTPTLLLTLHPAPALDPAQPPQAKVILSSHRVPVDDPLTAIKSCNRLRNILARAEADAAGADEAILLNSSGHIACASAANVFVLRGNRLLTPPIRAGALPGVTRAAILKLAPQLNLEPAETDLLPADLANSDAIFLTQSSRGVVEVTSVDGKSVKRSLRTRELYEAWRTAMLE
jgi:branched-chain amino acid aminotransferase